MKDPFPNTADSLRLRAEKLALGAAAPLPDNPDTPSPAEMQRVFHELRVHLIELEMQNEELHRIQTELEISQAHYFDLYDLAPIGYFTLSENGMILEANLHFSNMLGVVRSVFVNRPLSRFILPFGPRHLLSAPP